MKNDIIAQRYITSAKARVSALLERHDLQQAVVAEIVGASKASVSRYLDPENPVFFEIGQLAALCAHLRVPLDHALPSPEWIEIGSDFNAIFGSLDAQQQAWLLSIHQSALDIYSK